MKFYGIDPEALLRSKTWVLDALVRELNVLQAEEQLRAAQLWMLFGKQPGNKQEATTLRARQHAYLRRLKRQAHPVEDAPVQEREEVPMIDPSTLDEEERAAIKRWAEEQGIQTE